MACVGEEGTGRHGGPSGAEVGKTGRELGEWAGPGRDTRGGRVHSAGPGRG